jgi:hypothetical protein
MQMASNERQSTRRRQLVTTSHADERWRSIDLRATAFGGSAVTTAVILAFIWEIAHGRSGNPYAQLGAIAGVRLPGRRAVAALALLTPVPD